MQDDSPASAERQEPAPATGPAKTDRFVRLPAVLETVGTGRTMWLDLVKSRKAPQPVKIGRATLWAMSDLQSWMADRMREARRG